MMKGIISGIPYDSLTEKDLALREQNYQTAVYLIFALMNQFIYTEVHCATGRADCVVEFKDGELVITFAIPIYDDNNEIINVLAAVTLASLLSDQIDDIVIGKTGECYILGEEGSIIAHKKFDLVKRYGLYMRKIRLFKNSILCRSYSRLFIY